MGLQVAGDVGRAQHLATDVAGDLALMPDHVGAKSVFGSKGSCTSLQVHTTEHAREHPHTNRARSVTSSHKPSTLGNILTQTEHAR